METTFVLKPEELNSSFLNTLKRLFKNSNQLQISVSTAEDFGLLQTENLAQQSERIEKCFHEVAAKQNTISFSENELDQIILEKL